jgi:hypothetical protein
MTSISENSKEAKIPASLLQPGALRFWLAVLCTGIGAGVGAIIGLAQALIFLKQRRAREHGGMSSFF